jgi:hypothetical protein
MLTAVPVGARLHVRANNEVAIAEAGFATGDSGQIRCPGSTAL